MDYSKTKNKQEELAGAIHFLSRLLAESTVREHILNPHPSSHGYVAEKSLFSTEEIETIKGNMLVLIEDYINTTDELTTSLTDEQED